MKKFIQYTAVLGAVLSVIGFGTAWAAKINGGEWGREEIFDTSFTMFPAHYGHNAEGGAAGHREIEPARERAAEEIAIEAEAMEEADVGTGEERTVTEERAEGMPVFRFPAARELNISVGAGEVEVAAGEVSEIQIFCDQETLDKNWVKAIQDEDGEELDIQVKKPVTSHDGGHHPQVLIMLPADYLFHSIDVSLAAGNFRAVSLRAEELDAEVAAGNAEFLECAVTDVSFNCVTGNIAYSGAANGDIDGECAMGNIQLSLTQKETDFNYELQGVGGTIRIGGLELGGLAFEREIFNNSSREMDLECTTGSILVDFSE